MSVAELVEECMRQGKSPALSLDPFTIGFVECGLSNCYLELEGEQTEETLRSIYTRDDIDILSLAKMRDECLLFQQQCISFYSSAWDYLGDQLTLQTHGGGQRARELLAGSDFWMTRTHAGVGFWDGDWVFGDELTEACKQFGDPDLYVGDDGRLYYL